MRSLRIVVADDEPITRIDVKKMLTELGHQVVGEARNGAMALELVQKLRPDLVILDVRMAKMDGIKAAKLITGQKLCAVLLLTAYSEEEVLNRALDAGIMGYLTKPVAKKELEPSLRIAWVRYQDLMALKHKKLELIGARDRDIRREKIKNTGGAVS